MDIYTVKKLAEETGWSEKTIHDLARYRGLPIRYAPGHERGGVVLLDEFNEWLKRKGYTKGTK